MARPRDNDDVSLVECIDQIGRRKFAIKIAQI
jgi:hypothetical protein